jgi:hypothetical protein
MNNQDEQGRFIKGNKAAVGNPNAARVARLRTALLAAVSPDDISDIIKSLVRQAKSGDVAAAKLLLDRCIGKDENENEIPQPPDYSEVKRKFDLLIERKAKELIGTDRA